MNEHLLSTILFAPLAGMVVLLLIPKTQVNLIRLWANFVAIGSFLMSLLLIGRVDNANGGMQLIERMDWIPSIGSQYLIGIDGISLLMVLLTTTIGFVAVLCSWTAVEKNCKEYYAMLLLQQTGMLGVFLAMDFMLFYVFWELVLVPMYILIGVWGGPRKLYAAIKFVMYTLAGSVFMLLGILTLYSFYPFL